MRNRIVFGVLLAGLYALLAFLAAGGGHGTYLFFAPLMPYGIGGVTYPLLFGISSRTRNNFWRLIYIVVLLTHYFVATIFVTYWLGDDLAYLVKTWEHNALLIILPAILLGALELLLLIFLFRDSRVANTELP